MHCFLATATGVNEDTTKDSSIGNPIPTVVSGSRGTAETTESSKIYGTVPPPTNAPAPVTQAIPHLGKFTFVYILQFIVPLSLKHSFDFALTYSSWGSKVEF